MVAKVSGSPLGAFFGESFDFFHQLSFSLMFHLWRSLFWTRRAFFFRCSYELVVRTLHFVSFKRGADLRRSCLDAPKVSSTCHHRTFGARLKQYVIRFSVPVFLDDDVTDEIRINVGSAVSSFVSNNADGGADFVVHGIHVWDLGSDIYGAFDLNNTLELNFLALMENGEGPILGFQENMAEINLGIFSHIR